MTTLAGQSLVRHIDNGDLSTCNQILQSGAINMEERDADGQTFLMVAAYSGHFPIVKELLLQPFVDVNAVDNDNWTALLNSSKEGHDQIVKLLLDVGALVDHRDTAGWTALMWSCYKGNTGTVHVLLDHHANPNVKGEHHMSCLTWASGRGYLEIVRALLAHGAKINTTDKYGTSPLIWACRKGFTEIVDILLHAGASVDNSGMNSWTALHVASKGSYVEVVEMLLDHSPNVNAVDKDGFTALTWAAKNGSFQIAKKLLEHGAYVNLPDRNGDTILIHAVKGGHLEVVRVLLKKYADVDVEGEDHKTAIFWAVEKGHVNIARALVDFSANVEIANKDGDTPLIKAVRMRNYDLVRLLMDKNAKVSTANKRGDTALHISVRGRSKRIVEQLLRNPKDGRLLYKPNKTGETPYTIDASKDKSILTQVFGTRNLNAGDNLKGYELYSSTIADILSEPSLNTPMTVGLYAKWGSGKSFLTDQLKKDLTSFADQQCPPEFEFSVLQGVISVLIALILGLVLWLTVDWRVGLGVGLGVLTLQFVLLGLLILTLRKKDWGWTYTLSTSLAQKIQTLRLLLQVIFCNQPRRPKRESATVKFLFTNNARLATVVGEKSITTMISTLSEALEEEFGLLVTRFYRVFKPRKAEAHGRFKSVCCIPYFLITILILLCVVSLAVMLGYFGIHSTSEPGYKVVDSILISLGIIIGLALIGNIYTWGRMIANLVMPAKRRIRKIGERLDALKSEGFMQSLKREVELMAQMTNCMDAFLQTYTRLVVIVDGLDSCEQEKLLQVLDTLHMLFGDSRSPFITVLAVDPHIIVKGIESNSHLFFRDTSINGHDYLRNVVHLPVFLQCQKTPDKRFVMHENKSDAATDASGEGLSHKRGNSQGHMDSSLSITEAGLSKGKKGRQSFHQNPQLSSMSQLMRQPSHTDLSRSLGKNSYFSDLNPRSMKRLMNIIAVTGRLLRAQGIDFSWYKLAMWINITEQWPYRLSWMILEEEDNEQEIKDKLTLKSLYDRVQGKLPSSKEVEPLLEIDRNVRKLELLLTNQVPVLTVGDMRRFLPCTVNVDPYLRKLIKELQQNLENMNAELSMGMGTFLSPKSSDMMPAYTRTHRNSGDRQNSLQRITPTRGTFSRGLAASPYGMAQGGIFVPPQMMMNSAGNPYYPPMMAGFSQSPTSTLGGESSVKGKVPRVKLQGGLPSERLSRMSVDTVCNLVRRLDGINAQQLPVYQNRLQEHNISGLVLVTCDLPELKTVMQMSFGDWELFRTLVQMLREKDAAMMNCSSESLDSLSKSPEKFTGELNVQSPQAKVEAPQPQYVSRQNTTTSTDQTTTGAAAGGSVEEDRDHNGSSSNYMMEINDAVVDTASQRVKYTAYQSSLEEDQALVTMEMPRRKMQREDSIMFEMLSESSALQNMLSSVGIQEEEDDEEEEEEEHQITVTEKNSKPYRDMVKAIFHQQDAPAANGTEKLVPKERVKKYKKHKQKDNNKSKDYSRESDQDNKTSTRSSYSSVYSVGGEYDSDSSASEKELQLMNSRKRQNSVQSIQSRSQLMSMESIVDSSSEPPSSPLRSGDLRSSINRGMIVVNAADQFGYPTGYPMEESSRNIDRGHRQPSSNRQLSYSSSLQLSSEQITPILTPTSSHEYLALSRLSQHMLEEGMMTTPSAFKPVSQAASRASSRASSRAESTKSSGNASGRDSRPQSAGRTRPTGDKPGTEPLVAETLVELSEASTGKD